MPSTKRQSDSDGEVSLSKKLRSGKENKTNPKIYGRIVSLDNATAANKNPGRTVAKRSRERQGTRYRGPRSLCRLLDADGRLAQYVLHYRFRLT